MVGRAVRLRCPWCGARRTFVRRWLWRDERCRTCGIRWNREVGFELGPMTLNIIATFLVLVVAMTVVVAATLPDIPVHTTVIVLVAGAVVLPVLLYPFGYTLWLAGDLAAHPPSTDELADAAAHAGNT